MKNRYNVPEELPGVKWQPEGGYFLVFSHQTDNTLGFDDVPSDVVEAQRAQEPAEAADRQALAARSALLGVVAFNLLAKNAPSPGFDGIAESIRTMTEPARIRELQEALAAVPRT